jgi:hypothetical protein
MASSSNPGDRPMPGPNVFSAEEEKAMRQGNRVAPAPTPQKIDSYLAQQEPYRIGPDDATDDQ